MIKKSLSLKEIFETALKNYKDKNYEMTENLCKKILSINSNHFDSLVLLSNILAMNNKFSRAKELLVQANGIKPNNLSVLNNLGTACKELNDVNGSIAFYEKVLKFNPNHTNALYNLGIAFYNLKEIKKAKNFFLKAAEIQPNYALAFFNLGNINAELKEYNEAVSNYKKAIEINSKIVGAHNNLGLVFRILNDYEAAINCYEKAIKINNNHVGAIHNLALAFKELGKFKKSIELHEKATRLEPNNLMNYFYLSELKKDILDENLKNKIHKFIKSGKSTQSNSAYGNYLLAKYERKNHDYEKELSYLKSGHHCFFTSREQKFKLGLKYCFEDILQISQGVKVNKTNLKSDKIIKPIFIVGVPRCGSTLVEKIIGSGKKFLPLGEETTILENYINSKILEKKSLVLGDANETQNEVTNLYREKGLVLQKYDYRFTDKSLNNFFYLEVIKDVYPNAKIINCKRDVLSSIMSIFQNNITELAWVHDLENIFKYFDNYFDIIDNYRKVFPNTIYDLDFEKLVNNPEEESKKLMNFCNLDWDKKCLEFYKRKDLISKTASNIQIREAIYKHSLQKYLPYKVFLKKYGETYSWFN